MKFLSIADWTGIVETELFSKTYRSYGLATVRYPVLENRSSRRTLREWPGLYPTGNGCQAATNQGHNERNEGTLKHTVRLHQPTTLHAPIY